MRIVPHGANQSLNCQRGEGGWVKAVGEEGVLAHGSMDRAQCTTIVSIAVSVPLSLLR